jgi:hypothetical protein
MALATNGVGDSENEPDHSDFGGTVQSLLAAALPACLLTGPGPAPSGQSSQPSHRFTQSGSSVTYLSSVTGLPYHYKFVLIGEGRAEAADRRCWYTGTRIGSLSFSSR